MEPKIFNHPRPKNSLLPPPSKKRKTEHKIEEISFDFSAREDFLTGFHKRKVQRHKQAQLENEKKAKEEKIQMRKQVSLVPVVERACHGLIWVIVERRADC
jgi:ribosomal RNA-processing protein 17